MGEILGTFFYITTSLQQQWYEANTVCVFPKTYFFTILSHCACTTYIIVRLVLLQQRRQFHEKLKEEWRKRKKNCQKHIFSVHCSCIAWELVNNAMLLPCILKILCKSQNNNEKNYWKKKNIFFFVKSRHHRMDHQKHTCYFAEFKSSEI